MYQEKSYHLHNNFIELCNRPSAIIIFFFILYLWNSFIILNEGGVNPYRFESKYSVLFIKLEQNSKFQFSCSMWVKQIERRDRLISEWTEST